MKFTTLFISPLGLQFGGHCLQTWLVNTGMNFDLAVTRRGWAR